MIFVNNIPLFTITPTALVKKNHGFIFKVNIIDISKTWENNSSEASISTNWEAR